MQMFSCKIESFFRAEQSREGFGKKRIMFERSGVIAPHFQQQWPAQRISWEFIEDHIRSHKSRIIAAMKTARQNAIAGTALENLETIGSVDLFSRNMLQLLALFTDFDPENGFDLDMFLLINSARDMTRNVVLIELYPRRQKGRMETAFCTAQPMQVPFLTFDGDGNKVLHTLVFAEASADGEDFDSIHQRWIMRRAFWPLRERKTIDFFLDRCCHGVVHDPSGRYIQHEHAVTASGSVVRAGLNLQPVMRIVR